MDQVTIDLIAWENDYSEPGTDFPAELDTLLDTPEAEGMVRYVGVWCVGTNEEPDEAEIMARLASVNMLEESWYSEAYSFSAGAAR